MTSSCNWTGAFVPSLTEGVMKSADSTDQKVNHVLYGSTFVWPLKICRVYIALMSYFRWELTTGYMTLNVNSLSTGKCGSSFKCASFTACSLYLQVTKGISCGSNRPTSQILQCTKRISHYAPFCNRNVHTCAHFCYKVVNCGIWDWCIVEFVRQVYCCLNCEWQGHVTSPTDNVPTPEYMQHCPEIPNPAAVMIWPIFHVHGMLQYPR